MRARPAIGSPARAAVSPAENVTCQSIGAFANGAAAAMRAHIELVRGEYELYAVSV